VKSYHPDLRHDLPCILSNKQIQGEIRYYLQEAQ